MTLDKGATAPYIDPAKVSRPTKSGIKVITEMSTPRIISFVAYRHRVGLLAFSTVFMFGYVAYDKVINNFI